MFNVLLNVFYKVAGKVAGKASRPFYCWTYFLFNKIYSVVLFSLLFVRHAHNYHEYNNSHMYTNSKWY